MDIKRVLTIESVDDIDTRIMLQSIYSSDEFNAYEIDHFFFLKDDDDLIESEMLYRRLKESILAFKPDAILIHTGSDFEKNIKAFLDVLPKIKTIHKDLMIGLQRRSMADKRIIAICDDSEQIKCLEKLFFKTNR